MTYLANMLMRHRRWPACAMLALTGIAIWGLTRLGYDDVPARMLRSEGRLFERLAELHGDFGADDNDLVLLYQADPLFAPAPLQALQALDRRLEETDEVLTVWSIADAVVFDGLSPRPLLPAHGAPPDAFQAARDTALQHPLLAEVMVSDDATATLLIVKLAGGELRTPEIGQRISVVRRTIDEVAPPGVRVRLTGIPVVRLDLFTTLKQEQVLFLALGTAVGALISAALFRNLRAVIIAVAGPMTGALWSLGALGVIGQQVDTLTSVLPTLVIVIGFTDSVHLVYHLRQRRLAGASPREAAHSAVAIVGGACALTSLTTAIGFGSLILAELAIIRNFGLACACGVVLSFVAVVTITPLLASTRIGARVVREPKGGGGEQAPLPGQAAAGGLSALVIRGAKPLAVLGVTGTALLVAVALQLKPDSTMAEAVPSDSETIAALQYVDAHLGGTIDLFVLVEWPADMRWSDPQVAAALAEAARALRTEPLLARPISIYTVLQSLPMTPDSPAAREAALRLLPSDIVQRFLRPDQRRALVRARVPDRGTATMRPVLARLDERLEAVRAAHPELALNLTGTVVMAAENLHRMIGDLQRSLGFAILLIFGVLAVAFRSLRMGLLSIVPNLFPLALSAALLVFLGQPMRLTTVIVFTISLGIAVDDTIHFLSRYQRELRAVDDVPEAVRRTLREMTPVLLLTTAVLVGGYAPVGLSSLPVLRLFALLACVALATALIGDLIILPALLAVFPGRKRNVDVPPAR